MARESTTNAEHEFIVNGKRVHLRERLPLKVGNRLPALLLACQAGDLNDQVKVLCLMVESWDYDGDPTDPASYVELDVFTDIIPMTNAMAERVQQRIAGADLKNSASGPSLPSRSAPAS